MLWHYWGVLLSWYMKMKRKAIEPSAKVGFLCVFSSSENTIYIQELWATGTVEFNTRQEVRRNISLQPLLSPQAYRK